jgi:aspartate dehydrogenase
LIKLAILGCGNIGRFVMSNLGREEFKEFQLTAIAGLPGEEAVLREFALAHGCSYTCDPTTLADRQYDLVLEAAHPAAVRQYAPAILRAGVNVVAMSVGAFADSKFLAEAKAAAEDGNVRLLLPTGAIAGLDNLKAAGLVGIEEASLTMTKAPAALAGAPYFDAHPVDLFAIREPTVVFEGTAAEAIKGFPQNVNVAVALSLATLGPDRTKLRVVCDPKASRITVDIHARGATGELRIQMVNLPSPANPKTSYQACCSALAALLRFSDRVQVGT